jgi:acyl-[acyl-carrier-protein]-phospholipid O-acyltransferase/long-chain-fatty-acid--[acyl-carrier-protein] ligase
MPRRIPYPVTVSFGRPMPPTSTAIELRRAVQELQADAFHQRKRHMRTLDRTFVRTARRFPLRFMMADGKTPKVTFASALTKSIYIARRLRPLIGKQQMVGLLLPPSVGGALTNCALMMLGRIGVNLNYTASSEVIASGAGQCNLDVVITSKAFVERFPKLAIPGRTLFLEDALQTPRITEKLVALVLAWTIPQRLLGKAMGAAHSARKRSVDDLATVIFSSGSTGDPKGVMLTHFNIVSNIQQVSQVFMLGGSDKILGILLFLHSFGFMAGLWLPAVNGFGAVYHPNPLDTGMISEYVWHPAAGGIRLHGVFAGGDGERPGFSRARISPGRREARQDRAPTAGYHGEGGRSRYRRAGCTRRSGIAPREGSQCYEGISQ